MGSRSGLVRKALLFAACAVAFASLHSPHAGATDVVTAGSGAKKIPPPPRYYVLDEPGVLEPRAKQSLETLLIEHDRASGEQILIAVFNSLDGEDPVDFTNRVFSSWRIGKRGKDNGVLLALYWKEHRSRLEVGYGLESTLTDAKSKLILADALTPELRNGNPSRALALASLEILKVLESPLIANGSAEQILRGGGFHGSLRPARRSSGGVWTVWVVVGFILIFIVLNSILSADAHFTGGGWYRPRPMSRRRWWGGGFGGGGLGGWGGGSDGGDWGGGGSGGGFIGGGGSSGGGGATGDW